MTCWRTLSLRVRESCPWAGVPGEPSDFKYLKTCPSLFVNDGTVHNYWKIKLPHENCLPQQGVPSIALYLSLVLGLKGQAGVGGGGRGVGNRQPQHFWPQLKVPCAAPPCEPSERVVHIVVQPCSWRFRRLWATQNGCWKLNLGSWQVLTALTVPSTSTVFEGWAHHTPSITLMCPGIYPRKHIGKDRRLVHSKSL